MYKQSILEESSHFGNQHVTMSQYLEKTGRITAFYEHKSRMGSGSSLSIQLVITPDKELLEAKITNRGIITSKTAGVSMKFDQLGNLVKDSYLGEYEKMAREYEANFKSFLENLRIKTKFPSPQEAFKSLAANVGKIPTSEFSKIVLVQHDLDRVSVYVTLPSEIVQKYNLKNGELAYWKAIGDRLTLKVIKGEHKNVTRVREKANSLVLSIPIKIQTEANFQGGMSFKFEKITDGNKKFILLKPDVKSQDIKIYRGDRANLFVSSKSQLIGEIGKDTLVDWKIHENGILLELLGSHPYPIKIYGKGSSLLATVPRPILTELIEDTISSRTAPMPVSTEMKIKNLKKAEWMIEGDQILLKPILELGADNKKIEI